MARVLYGGSFNPPHIGHCRLVLEIWESMQHVIDGIDVIPCARPPHKDGAGLLPFDLRAEMLEGCMEELGFAHVSRMEGERDTPSYTYDTLTDYRKEHPGEAVYFLVGSHDFFEIPTWFRGRELPSLCHFLLVPRGANDMSGDAFVARTLDEWPGAVEEPCRELRDMPGARCVRLVADGNGDDAFVARTLTDWPGATEEPCRELRDMPGARCVRLVADGNGDDARNDVGLVHYLPLPWFDISASQVRDLWLRGWHVDYLVPEVVRDMLSWNSHDVHACWDPK